MRDLAGVQQGYVALSRSEGPPLVHVALSLKEEVPACAPLVSQQILHHLYSVQCLPAAAVSGTCEKCSYA